jgi:hypothetical protein
MAKGSAKSVWTVAYDPHTQDHLPYSNRRVSYWPADMTFTGELIFIDFERGRSSVTVQLGNKRGFVYSMFLSEFMRIIPHLICGRISGTWGFEKNGPNTGVYLVSL